MIIPISFSVLMALILVWELRASARWKRWMLFRTRRVRRERERELVREMPENN